jgi:hypothetical protein
MTKASGRPSRKQLSPPPGESEPQLPVRERAELQRQGAKAAARGDKAASNPLQQPENRPPATGESTDSWQARQEAWQQGHDAQTASRRRGPPADLTKAEDDDPE